MPALRFPAVPGRQRLPMALAPDFFSCDNPRWQFQAGGA